MKDISVFNSRENVFDEQEQDVFVVIGGDGSLNHFVNTFNEYELSTVIYFPMGTANDFARNFNSNGVKPTLETVLNIFKSKFYMKIPVMKCNERSFINAASLGLPANITQDQNGVIKKLTGPLSYHISAISELFAHEVAQEVTVEGESFLSLGMIVAQGLYAGGGVRVCPYNYPQFGESFSLVLHTGENIGPSISALFSIQSSDFENIPKEIITKNFKSLKISFQEKQTIKLDGEVYESSSFEFKKSERFINFFILK